MVNFFGIGFLSAFAWIFYCLPCVSHENRSAFNSKKEVVCRVWLFKKIYTNIRRSANHWNTFSSIRLFSLFCLFLFAAGLDFLVWSFEKHFCSKTEPFLFDHSSHGFIEAYAKVARKQNFHSKKNMCIKLC